MVFTERLALANPQLQAFINSNLLNIPQNTDMDVQKTRIRRLKQVISEKSGSAAAFARAHGIEASYLSQLINQHRSFGERAARKMEMKAGLPAGYLDFDDGQPGSNVSLIDRPTTRVPLISWVKAGEWCESPDLYEPGDADEWIESPFHHGTGSFCLRVAGDSMFPEYRDGEIILVDPTKECRHNSDVVARTPDPDNRTLFKRYQDTPDGQYLLALNPSEPNRKIEMPPGTHICGVVIGSFMKRG